MIEAKSESDFDENASTRCRVCREPIVKGAKKCVHCDSFQNWRRYLNLSTGVLSLLIALISVLTVAVPVFKSALTVKKSAVHYSFLRYDPKTMYVICSNLGNQPGILKRAKMSIFVNNKESHETSKSAIDLKWDQTNPIIKPNESKIFGFYYEYYGDKQEFKECDASVSACHYHIEFEVVDPGDTIRKKVKTFPCVNCD